MFTDEVDGAGRVRGGHPRASGYTRRHRVRHGRQLAGARGARRGATRGRRPGLVSGCSTRPIRRPFAPRTAPRSRRDTLRIIATKSGTTTETLAFLAHFWESEQHRLGRFHGSQAGDGFVAITDPGGSLEAIPHGDLFRETFLNPPDVGGRYSALTYVGLVPAALHGPRPRCAARRMRAAMAGRSAIVDDGRQPGRVAGRCDGRPGAAGRDKLTFVIEPDLAPLGRVAGAAHRGVAPASRDGHRARRRRAARGARASTAPTASSSASAAPSHDRWHAGCAARRARRGGPPGHRHPAHRRRLGRRRVLALGGRDGDRRRRAGRRPLRRAQRDRIEAEHHGPRSTRTPATARLPDGARRRPRSGVLRLYRRRCARARAARRHSAADVLRAHLARAADAGYHAICALHRRHAGADRRAAAHPGAAARPHAPSHDARATGPASCTRPGSCTRAARRTGCFLQLVAGHPDDLPIPGPRDLRDAHRCPGAGRPRVARSPRPARRCASTSPTTRTPGCELETLLARRSA